MPCRDDNYNETDLQHAVNRVRKELEPLLCEACSLMEEFAVLPKASQELRTWFKNHEECEKHRVAYEGAMKLSERERRLLGIDLASLKAKMENEKAKK